MDETQNRNNRWRRLKLFAGLTVMLFSVTLAVVIGHRLSDEALAVLAGAVCGVGAAIPTSLLVVAVSRRRDAPRDADRFDQSAPWPPHRSGTYPPVVVIAPPGMEQRPDVWNGLPPSLAAPTQRTFTVVGGAPAEAEMAGRYAAERS